MSGRIVELAEAAVLDWQEITRYLSETAGEAIARRISTDFEERFERLKEHPHIGRTRPELAATLRSTRVEPYTIFYRIADCDVFYVMRILHERRHIRPEEFFQ